MDDNLREAITWLLMMVFLYVLPPFYLTCLKYLYDTITYWYKCMNYSEIKCFVSKCISFMGPEIPYIYLTYWTKDLDITFSYQNNKNNHAFFQIKFLEIVYFDENDMQHHYWQKWLNVSSA